MTRKFGTYLFFVLILACVAAAQNRGTVRGRVTDPSGAVVIGATVTVATPDGTESAVTTNSEGTYEVRNLAPGKYSVRVAAEGFAPSDAVRIDVAAGQAQTLDIPLAIAVATEAVEVEDQSNTIDTSTQNSASSVVIKGKELEALSDDPEQLQSDLEALAGPAAGPNGGQIFIDGFSNGQLPPKSSIREIRINQNPFSAEYDRLGFGRIEILTKPGQDKFRGQFMTHLNHSALNSRSPFAPNSPDYHSEMFTGNVSGPITLKSSFFLNVERRNMNETSIVNAVVLDPNFEPVPVNDAVLSPRVRTSFSPRVDYQLTQNNTLIGRYQFSRSTDENDDIGEFALVSRGTNSKDVSHSFQLSDTHILNASTINEARFQYSRNSDDQFSLTSDPSLLVIGAFEGGGSGTGININRQNSYELHDFVSRVQGSHFFKVGGRLRVSETDIRSTSGYNGSFTFPSLDAYAITMRGLAESWTPEQIRNAGGGARQFTITAGNPEAHVSQTDLGLYAQDDWKLRPSVTLSYGLRFETQTNVNDKVDLAPRIGVAWGIGGKNSAPKTVLRVGFGIFYDRFSSNLVMQSQRLNGINQQRYVVTSPDFYPNIPALDELSGALATSAIYNIDPNLDIPYTMQGAVTVERQLSKAANLAVTYIASRGLHQLVARNINAPLPGTYDAADPASAVYPLGEIGNVYQYSSDGVFNQQQLIANGNVRMGSGFSLFGFYMLGRSRSNTSGASSFPTNSYDLAADYGRAPFDVRHRVTIGGNVSLPYSFRLSPFIVASSGRPFNITVGEDLNGDSIFNDRPAYATDLTRASVVATRWGAFDLAPIAGQAIIPTNLGTAPGQFTVNLRVSKTIGFGPKLERAGGGAGSGPMPGSPGMGGGRGHGGGGFGGGHRGGPFGGSENSGRRYSLTLSASARNLFNRVNLGTPVGNLSSPFFGQSTTLAGGPFGSASANRRIDIQAMFSF